MGDSDVLGSQGHNSRQQKKHQIRRTNLFAEWEMRTALHCSDSEDANMKGSSMGQVKQRQLEETVTVDLL